MPSPSQEIIRRDGPLLSALVSLILFCPIIVAAGHGAAPAGLFVFWLVTDQNPFESFAAFAAWGVLLFFPLLVLLRPQKAFAATSAAAIFCLWFLWIWLLIGAEIKGGMAATSIPFFIAQIFWVRGYIRYLRKISS